MGYRTVGYGVDMRRLEQVWSCTNHGLLADVLASSEPRIRSHNELLPGTPERDVISITDALEDIIKGELRDPSRRSAFQYLYALEILCSNLGKMLDGGEAIGGIENLSWETRLLEVRIPLGLPDPHDFPRVSYLTAAEVEEEYHRFGAGFNPSDEPVDGEVEDAREDFLWRLKQCCDDEVGLVTFYY
jgi:hypothetical protein